MVRNGDNVAQVATIDRTRLVLLRFTIDFKQGNKVIAHERLMEHEHVQYTAEWHGKLVLFSFAVNCVLEKSSKC